uniref:Uncharacterized protein n=1 Tax=Trieres chinensis TaxID=1514140 RepID=A0A7S2EPJ3_TRICV
MNALTSTAARGAVAARSSASRTAQRRNMGSGGPKPEWTGIDKVVRGYFPEDYQLAGAILGGYGALIAGFSLKSKFSSAPEAAAAPAAPVKVASAGGDAVPSVDSPEFESYIEGGGFDKMLESEDALNKWVESA